MVWVGGGGEGGGIADCNGGLRALAVCCEDDRFSRGLYNKH